MTDEISLAMLIEHLNRRSEGDNAERVEPLSVDEAIATDLALDAAIAAAIEREVGKPRA